MNCILLKVVDNYAEIIDDDLFKLIVAFGFSTSPAVLGYTTWTIPTRGLLVILTPLLIYLLLRCRTSIKYIPLTILLAVLLFATHHLFYFLFPPILRQRYIRLRNSYRLYPSSTQNLYRDVRHGSSLLPISHHIYRDMVKLFLSFSSPT